MNTKQKLELWQKVERPEDCTNECGDSWTGEVETEGHTLWFFYRDSNGDMYMSQQTPVLKLDLRTASYVCIPESKATMGLNQ